MIDLSQKEALLTLQKTAKLVAERLKNYPLGADWLFDYNLPDLESAIRRVRILSLEGNGTATTDQILNPNH